MDISAILENNGKTWRKFDQVKDYNCHIYHIIISLACNSFKISKITKDYLKIPFMLLAFLCPCDKWVRLALRDPYSCVTHMQIRLQPTQLPNNLSHYEWCYRWVFWGRKMSSWGSLRHHWLLWGIYPFFPLDTCRDCSETTRAYLSLAHSCAIFLFYVGN